VRTIAPSAFTISVAAELLVGCGGSQPPIRSPEMMPQVPALAACTTRTNYKVLYSFGALPDGAFPVARLIDVGGTLYGTTLEGGTGCAGLRGCGTVFRITTGGAEKVLYRFGVPYDAESPYASLLDVRGTLYGTTRYGGATGVGTVFSITSSGTEKVLHSFRFNRDGELPIAGLIDVSGTLYGTTAYGGDPHKRHGTVFSVTRGGTEKVFHDFGGSDGRLPEAALIGVNGALYGTTNAGGTSQLGTVFSVSTSGAEKVLHSFGGSDGAHLTRA
jgi:uncharacterized repeat protein (TIGR03803 family)